LADFEKRVFGVAILCEGELIEQIFFRMGGNGVSFEKKKEDVPEAEYTEGDEE